MEIISSKRRRIIVYEDMLHGGYSVMMAYLCRPYEDDEKVGVEDIRKVDTLMHFCDKGSVEKMIEVLTNIRDEWGKKDV